MSQDIAGRDFVKEVVDFLKDLFIIIAIVLFVRTFLIMPFQINGQSMYDSYYDGEFIIVDRFSYRDIPFLGQHREMQRGDVVVFKPRVNDNRKYFIKRVIGLPGETLKIEGGKVYVKNPGSTDFIELNESYLSEENFWKTYVSGQASMHIYEIPEGEYFVMGDNRNASTDSRTCFSRCDSRSNYIDMWDITGKVFIDLWYFSFRNLSFTHPNVVEGDVNISTKPKFFSSPATFEYSF